MIPEVGAATSLPNPVWPELDAEQKAEALAATWPGRLRFALLGAAILAFVTGAGSYRAAGGAIDWRVGISLTLGSSFLASYFLIKTQDFSRRWLAPAGLITITLTLINLMACLLEQFQVEVGSKQASADPAFVFLALVVGSLWALRIHVSPVSFTLGAAVTAAILWAPWITLTQAPAEFALTGLACLAVGAQMRWIGAERAYAAYRRKVVWPQLWRGSMQAAVLRELSRRTAMTVTEEPRGAIEALAEAVDGVRTQGSLVSLAAALGGSESPAKQDGERQRSSATDSTR